MAAKIEETNGFRAMAALRKAAQDSRIEEIEGHGMDPGRVFLHCKPGFWFRESECMSCSVGSAAEIRDALASLEPDPRTDSKIHDALRSEETAQFLKDCGFGDLIR